MRRLMLALTAVGMLGAAAPAVAAPLPLPWGGFEPYDANEGDVFGILCKSDRGLRAMLDERGYQRIRLGPIDDENHRVLAKAERDGATWLVLMNSCTGKIIDRNPL